MGRGEYRLCDTVEGRVQRGRKPARGREGLMESLARQGEEMGRGEAVARMRWGAVPVESGWPETCGAARVEACRKRGIIEGMM